MKQLSPLMVVLRFSIGLSLVILFWWLVGTRLTIPAWQVAVLPAAVLGFVIAYGETKWSVLLAVCIVAGAFTSEIVGEWFHVYGRLVAAREHSMSANVEESLMDAIAKHQSLAEGAKPTDANQAVLEGAKSTDMKSGEEKPADVKEEQKVEQPRVIIRLPPVDFMTAGRMAWDRAKAEWIQHFISIVLSLLAAGQAARMTIHSRAKRV